MQQASCGRKRPVVGRWGRQEGTEKERKGRRRHAKAGGAREEPGARLERQCWVDQQGGWVTHRAKRVLTVHRTHPGLNLSCAAARRGRQRAGMAAAL